MSGGKRKVVRRTATPRRRARPSAKIRPAPIPVADVLKALHEARRHEDGWLDAEKARRGLGPESLVFVGMHNVAQALWCAMYARLKSEDNEHEFFGAYLSDRVRWAAIAGRVSRMPTSREEWLSVGDDLTLAVVERMWMSAVRAAKPSAPDSYQTWVRSLSPEAAARIVAMSGPFEVGNFYEARYAEVYPKLRWNFPSGHRVVVGVADGMHRCFIYEFKTAQKRFFLDESRAIAFAQADLYGSFFQRPAKRIHIAVRDTNTVEKWQEPVDAANATAVLARFDAAVAGATVTPPPPGKCRSCAYRKNCSVAPVFGTTAAGKEVLRTKLIEGRQRAADSRRATGQRSRAAATERLVLDVDRLVQGASPSDDLSGSPIDELDLLELPSLRGRRPG
ncbi:MAG TPA: hypothetical protein VHE35_02470 [Kofleriaceae bacterium]|nr:hypothetical protein [Kofleriaceae bacterium]